MEKELMLRNKICIIPKPVSMVLRKGKFIITNKTIIESDPKLIEVAKFFKRLLKPATGFDLLIVNSKSELNKLKKIFGFFSVFKEPKRRSLY